MTLAELHERIGWQLEGRLQHLTSAGWLDWSGRVDSELSCPRLSDAASVFRRRPQPTLPDEVWIAEYQGVQFNSVLGAHKTREHCASGKDGATPIRYIRADAVIDGARLQSKFKGPNAAWHSTDTCEYRFKP